MTEEIIIDECFNCKKKKDIGDNWRTCKLKCSYKYKRKENDYIARLEQENENAKTTVEECHKYMAKLEDENEKLKESLKMYQYSDQQHLLKVIEYEKAFEEIRKLTVIGVNASQCNCGLRALADDILDKINEVLE